MAQRLERAARAARLDRDAPRIAGLFRTVLERRAAGFDDPHHPDFLHPGRTVLILLNDARCRDPDLLLAALLFDSDRPGLGPTPDQAEREAGHRAAAIARGLGAGPAGDADRLEWLVQLDDDALLLALAERLDHARHLHLAAPERWRDFHHRFGTADLPAAARSDPRIAARIRWWHESFARRFLSRPR